jgi:peptidoglycan/LPS O-acetylase OafA/YrhL
MESESVINTSQFQILPMSIATPVSLPLEPRQNSRNKILSSLQVFRALAAIFVVLCHATQAFQAYYQINPFNGFFLFGFSGVHIFFVLSGFIIYHIHSQDIGQPQVFIKFIKKRSIRIYPIYWLSSTLYLLISVFLLHKDIKFNIILQNIFLVTMPEAWINPVAWTLAYEIFFYFIFSWLILNQKLGSFIIYIYVVAIIVPPLLSFLNLPYANQYTILFFFGLLSSFAAHKLSTLPGKNRISFLSFIAGFALFISTVIYYLNHHLSDPVIWPVTIGFGLSSSLMMMSVLSETLEKFFKKQKLLNFLGDASYSIYLLHYPILQELMIYLKSQFIIKNEIIAYLLFLTISILTIVIGCIFYKKVESPLLSFLRKRILIP